MTPKAQATEDKQTKWTLGKYLNFVHPKLLYSQSEKATHRMTENSCESLYLIRNYYPKYIVRKLLKLNNEKPNSLIQNTGKGLK